MSITTSQCWDPMSMPGARAIQPASVAVDGVVLPGNSALWPGSGGMVSEVKGWLNPGRRKGQSVDLALTHGAVRARRALLGSAAFTVSGAFKGVQGDVLAFGEWLAALAARTEVRVEVDDGVRSTYRMAEATPDLGLWQATGFTRWSVDFVAPDPLRYGEWRYTEGVASTATVHNAGSAPSRVHVELVRNAARQTVSTPSGLTVFELPAGVQRLVFDPDLAGGRVTLNGTPTGGVLALSWPEVQPESNLTIGITGASAWRLGVRDAWF